MDIVMIMEQDSSTTWKVVESNLETGNFKIRIWLWNFFKKFFTRTYFHGYILENSLSKLNKMARPFPYKPSLQYGCDAPSHSMT